MNKSLKKAVRSRTAKTVAAKPTNGALTPIGTTHSIGNGARVIWPPTLRVKKGCGQRKNRRDRAGRQKHQKHVASGAGWVYPSPKIPLTQVTFA